MRRNSSVVEPRTKVPNTRRGSSVVERSPEKAGVVSSILTLGTLVRGKLRPEKAGVDSSILSSGIKTKYIKIKH